MTYNDEQKRIIGADLSKNLLVSAAAGSGKTTVLTERIVSLLSDEIEGVKDISLSDILIMTFTRKATREMANRIRIKLSDKLSIAKGDLRKKLLRELAIIQNANIFTIDAFCKKIVDDNYTLLTEENSQYFGFDPNYRIADNNEMGVIKEDILSDLLEEKYLDEEYTHLFDSYIDKTDESKLRSLLLSGLDKLSSMPWPYKFLTNLIDNFESMSSKVYETYLGESKKGEADKRLIYNENDLLYTKLLRDYYVKILDEKKKRNIYEINDYAHIALDILYGTDAISKAYKCIFVDEYQDTNFLQEKILEALSNSFRDRNVFMVGDVKQSIYRFRNAEPSIFVDKYNRYKNDPNGIDMTLSVNYRSSKEVIDYVNNLFSKTMIPSYGDIDYNDGNFLIPRDEEKARGYDADKKVEIRAICKDVDFMEEKPEVKHPGIEYEACFVADEIERLVRDKKCKYNQIVILLRNVRNKAKVFIDALNKKKIPVYSEDKTGFFDRLEIKLVIDILSIIDNPTKNLPLASVLMSDIYGLSNDELSFIKLIELDGTRFTSKNAVKESLESIGQDKNRNPNFNLYNALLYIKELLDNEESVDKEEIDNFSMKLKKYGIKKKDFSEKIIRFFRDFEDAKLKARYMKISDLVDYVYENYRIRDIMSVMPDGTQRLANLDSLYDFALKFESSSSIGLFNFNRYIEKITEIEKDQGQAKIYDENANVVRIMTIHSAKGLEFDTVFLCDSNNKYRFDESKEEALYQFDKDCGFALDYFDIDKKICTNTPKKELLRKKREDEIRQEELRMLYVALTRAVNKLYIVGNIQKSNSKQGISFKRIDEIIDGMNSGELEVNDVSESNSFFHVILNNLPSLSNAYCNFEKVVYSIKDTVVKEENFDLSKIKGEGASDLKLDLVDTYEYKDYQKLSPKFSVSSLKEASHTNEFVEASYASPLYEDTDDVYEDKKLADSEELSGAELGTAYHRFMEYYDYTNPNEPNRRGSARAQRQSALGVHCEPVIPEDKLTAFLSTNLGKEMKQAHDDHKLHREQKFMKLFSQSEIDALANHKGEPCELENRRGSARAQRQSALGVLCEPAVYNDQCIVIQGIIDAFYIKKDEAGNDYIVLVDYKTDSIKRKISDADSFSKELIDRYKVQLDIYARVLEELTGYEVRDKYIYSFALDKEIRL